MMKNLLTPSFARTAGCAALLAVAFTAPAVAITCDRNVSADVVVIDQPLMYNRLGASNVNATIYALKRDVIDKANKLPLTAGGAAVAGAVELRPDRRPRPLVLRVRIGDCLTVALTNLLTPAANPFNVPAITAAGQQFPVFIDEQPASRVVGFHAAGMQLFTSIDDDSSMVGRNHLGLAAGVPVAGLTASKGTTDLDHGGLAAPGETKTYKVWAEKEGVFIVTSEGVTVGSDGNEGHVSTGLFGQVIVEPRGARIYRGQVHEEEMRLATVGIIPVTGQPQINYEALYPNTAPWIAEGKAGLPVLNMIQCTNNSCQIVHSEINGVIVGPNDDGTFPASTYPLESVGKRNPTVPNRLEPFRDFASVYHDETAAAQAFPGFYVADPVFRYVLEGVKDAFMINYGSGGIGSEIIANRLGVGPMHDCLSCSYEEFFLTAFTVGDPAMLVDIPANLGLEALLPGQAPPAGTTGPKATYAIGAEDPSNVHHSYTGDFVKFRNTHIGKEQHVFHLHNHQWLYNPNDDNSNYLDAQGIGPGVGYTYEINFGGSGNRNKSAGDAIFHCHFYPHFAQGMWYLWRHHDAFEAGTVLAATPNTPTAAGVAVPTAFHSTPWALAVTTPAAGSRAYPDGEISTGTPIPAVVPLPGKALPVMPGAVTVVAKLGAVATTAATPGTTLSSLSTTTQFCADATGANVGAPPCIAGTTLTSVTTTTSTCLDAAGTVTALPCDPALGQVQVDVVATTQFCADATGANVGAPPCIAGTLLSSATTVTPICVNAAGVNVGTPPCLAPTAAVFPVVGSNALVLDRTLNPGYPFWIAGIEDIVGQRPPTPVLDMLSAAQATALKASGNPLWVNIDPLQAAGFDGGLPRHALQGYSAGGVAAVTVNNLDFTKSIQVAKPVYFPEEGTDLEKVAMAFHAVRQHPTSKVDMLGTVSAANFISNGLPPSVGAPYHEPCIDDTGVRLNAGVTGTFFSGETITGMSTRGASVFNAQTPRIYKGANIQFDAILNKVGYHYPQQRIISLWEDAGPVIAKSQPPEPLVMRLNTFDCAMFHHTNLVPEYYEMDDFQVRTPTDIIGQHIHLPKWDLTTTDGSANGWNYEDGTLSPGAVRERIAAIRAFNTCGPVVAGAVPTPACPIEQDHPYFGTVANSLGGGFPAAWRGARTTMQRWFADPVVNALGVDRGLGIIFTHDHYGPSSHQQIGLYATVLAEPAGSTWKQNETGTGLGCDTAVNALQPAGTTAPNVTPCRWDGGPTSWQAAIITPALAPLGSTVQSQTVPSHREFYFEFSDFQHAYEKGVYVGADTFGLPAPAPIVVSATNPSRATAPGFENTFRSAINPPARQQIVPLFPDLAIEVIGGIIPGCPARPCPQAISVQDPGVMVVNYRQEPVGLRVFDPLKLGPDGKAGAQAAGVAGDLAFALSSKLRTKNGTTITETPIARAIADMNKTEAQLAFWGKTLNAPTAIEGGDPFTPMMRAYGGDLVRVKIQAGGHEEEHNATIHGVKWLQTGSGFGRGPNSGWRNGQAAGISEQFTFSTPIVNVKGTLNNNGQNDHAYSVDTSMDGWWSGMWGLMRHYEAKRADLFALPNNANPVGPAKIVNRADFDGICPVEGAGASPRRPYSVVAILANDLLTDRKPAGLTLGFGTSAQHNGAAVNPAGGTLVYNPRNTAIPQVTIPADVPGAPPLVLGGHAGPLHDPTAMLYVRTTDLVAINPSLAVCQDVSAGPGVTNPKCPVKLRPGRKVEPLILRAAAGDCLEVTLYNRLPQIAPDLPTLATLQGVVKRDRNNAGGSVTFDNNLIRPSSSVGLHAQLLAMDVSRDAGVNVGANIVQTVAAVDPVTLARPKSELYRWYAGDIGAKIVPTGVRLIPTPIEFGGAGLMPADKIKQGQKSLVGAIVILPKGATIVEDANQHAQATVCPTGGTAACASATPPAGTFRDFMMVLTKDQNHRYADGFPVEHMNGEGAGLPEDSQENSNMALNYGIEPMWFRFAIPPNAPFGGAGCGVAGSVGGAGCYGGVVNAHQAYSNVITANADPATPVFKAKAGQEARLHVAVPHSTSRGSTLAIHGHVWQRDPYICPGENMFGLPGMCTSLATGAIYDPVNDRPMIGSKGIGNNPIGFAQGGQESITPYTHFTFRLPKAGGENAVPGDYLFRDKASFGNASGLWGILRVE